MVKTFEIQNAPLLTDLAFKDVRTVPWHLEEVKLVSCGSITSEAVCELSTYGSLEALDLIGFQSIVDSCLCNVSCLTLLTSLNLHGVDVTDVGMAVLGNGKAPISRLYLRGCKRATDKGINLLLGSEGKISKTLSSLDIGHMPGITDNAISNIAASCVELTELCIRKCFQVIDASVKALVLKGGIHGESKLLRRLDLCKCFALTALSFDSLRKPMFCGLQ